MLQYVLEKPMLRYVHLPGRTPSSSRRRVSLRACPALPPIRPFRTVSEATSASARPSFPLRRAAYPRGSFSGGAGDRQERAGGRAGVIPEEAGEVSWCAEAQAFADGGDAGGAGDEVADRALEPQDVEEDAGGTRVACSNKRKNCERDKPVCRARAPMSLTPAGSWRIMATARRIRWSVRVARARSRSEGPTCCHPVNGSMTAIIRAESSASWPSCVSAPPASASAISLARRRTRAGRVTPGC